jgi:hypothetical protein
MFGLAAVRREHIGDSQLNKFDSQSIYMIAVGRCQQSNGLQFYNPSNCTFVSSIDYKFQMHSTSGVHFGYKYQPGTFVYRLDESTTIFKPQFQLDSEVFIHTHSPPHRAKVVGLPSYDRPDVYTVLFPDGSLSEYSDSNNIIEAIPSSPTTSMPPSVLPYWIKSGVNATLFLSSMSKPRHGKLHLNSSNQWIFCPGQCSDLSKGILLDDLSANCQDYLDTGQLFRWHTKFKRVYKTRNQVQLKTSIL